MTGASDARRSYWSASRAPRYSLLFALPLLLAYEILAAALPSVANSGVRNGADVMFQRLFTLLAGPQGPLVFWSALIIVGLGLIVRDLRRHPGGLRTGVFLLMLIEAAVLSVVCGLVVGTLTTRLLAAIALQAPTAPVLDWPTRLMLSLGAGLYEELFFRVLVVSLLAWGARLLGWRPLVAGIFAVVVGAFLFSGFHYLGPYGDRFEVFSFTYRMIAGLFFSGLYLLRGFGITAWTHALYDVLVLLVLQR